MKDQGLPSFAPTRAEGLKRLHEFIPRAGRDYAESRNYDHGPGDRSNVSILSPYVRHRLVREDELVAGALAKFGPRDSEKFVQEVCWRTYWKGWLELRPSVWSDYRAEVDRLVAALDGRSSLRDRWEAATEGRTGIECLDAWSRELVETGYLHNHARMWYASLWIFTLELPWALGADFFFRHLLDADPASNTLSWRWVAGLQTRGKTYLASPSNVARYTSGRFRPSENFAEVAEPVDGPPPPGPRPLPRAGRAGEGPFGLLLTEEDLNPEGLGLEASGVAAVAGILDVSDRSPLPVGALAAGFASGAMDDALRRASSAFDAPAVRLENDDWHERVMEWATSHGLKRVVTPDAPQGPARERLDAVRESLGREGVALTTVRRAWDETFWPCATAGFFPFKEKIPERLARLGIFS